MYKIIALIGEAGSGKDSMLREILKYNSAIHEIVSCTTRPSRQGEVNGRNYYFLTYEEFLDKINNRQMLEVAHFNGWWYGTSYESLAPGLNVGVFNPEGVRILLKHDDIDLQVYRLKVEPKTRLIRQLEREEKPNVDEIIRRYKTDQDDFKNLNFKYTEIKNENWYQLIKGAKEIVLGQSY